MFFNFLKKNIIRIKNIIHSFSVKPVDIYKPYWEDRIEDVSSFCLSLKPEERRRVLMTISCSDTDDLPKVVNAGYKSLDNGIQFQYMHDGTKVLYNGYCGEWMSNIIYHLGGHHEPQEERVFYEVLKYLPVDATMVECGSNWSYYSLWFRRQYPKTRKNYCIEPDPKNLSLGVSNFALNGLKAEFFQYAVSDAPKTISNFIYESDGRAHDVKAISVDVFMKEKAIPHINLLHVDVQGAELQLLLGAEDAILNKNIDLIFISTHHFSISGDHATHQKCLEFLQKHEAIIICEHNVVESYSGDGLIVATFLKIPPLSYKLSRNISSTSLFSE